MALRVFVCRTSDVVPGALRGFPVAHATWPVMVTTVDGDYVAFPGVCPHEDVPLVDYGVREDDAMVRCRVHGYRFDLRTGECEHAQLHLRRYKVTISGDELWVDLL